MNASDSALYTVPDSVPVCCLDVREAFNGLTPKERAYAHNLSMASWAGAFISLIQVSPEAPRIFAGLTELFCACDAAALQANCLTAGISDNHFNAFMQYAASFYGNLGITPPHVMIIF
jgi:dipeptidyl-peptidase-3